MDRTVADVTGRSHRDYIAAGASGDDICRRGVSPSSEALDKASLLDSGIEEFPIEHQLLPGSNSSAWNARAVTGLKPSVAMPAAHDRMHRHKAMADETDGNK